MSCKYLYTDDAPSESYRRMKANEKDSGKKKKYHFTIHHYDGFSTPLPCHQLSIGILDSSSGF